MLRRRRHDLYDPVPLNPEARTLQKFVTYGIKDLATVIKRLEDSNAELKDSKAELRDSSAKLFQANYDDQINRRVRPCAFTPCLQQ